MPRTCLTVAIPARYACAALEEQQRLKESPKRAEERAEMPTEVVA